MNVRYIEIGCFGVWFFNVNVYIFLKIYKFIEFIGEMVDCYWLVLYFVNIYILKCVKYVDLDNCL